MRLLFLGFSSPVAVLEATGRKLAQERLGLKVSICGEKFPLGRSGLANDADSPQMQETSGVCPRLPPGNVLV